jgi:hypothetical protein
MPAQKLTPEDCLQTATTVAHVDGVGISLENGWDIFSSPRRDPYWKGKASTVYHREEGRYAECTVCGLKVEDEMIFFDENYEVRSEFHDNVRSGNVSRLADWIKSSQQMYPAEKQTNIWDIVWVATVEGKLYWMAGGHHQMLYRCIQPQVLRSDIVAAGRVRRDDKDITWQSDLLRITTDPALRPILTPSLLKIL